MADEAVILFDGPCGFCQRAVRFVAAHDPVGRFRFASLQSPAAARLLRPHGLDPAAMNSIVLVIGATVRTRSDALVRIAADLTSPWSALRAFGTVPRPLRDWAYDLVARNRYRWFSRMTPCALPPPGLADRFLS